MKNILATIVFASKKVLEKQNYKFWFVIFTGTFIFAYVLIPVWTIPGNTLSLQFSLLRARDYFLFLLFSVTISLLILMQIFLFINSRKDRMKSLGQGSVGIFSALFGGLLATAACSSCIVALIGFLGAGSVFFVLEKQPYIVLGAMALIVISLYFSARRIQWHCSGCGDYGKL